MQVLLGCVQAKAALGRGEEEAARTGATRTRHRSDLQALWIPNISGHSRAHLTYL